MDLHRFPFLYLSNNLTNIIKNKIETKGIRLTN